MTYLSLGVILALLNGVSIWSCGDSCIEVGDCSSDSGQLVGGESLDEGSSGGLVRLGGHQLGSNLHDRGQGGGIGQIHSWGLEQLSASRRWGV